MKAKIFKHKKIICLCVLLVCLLLIPRQYFIRETFHDDILKKIKDSFKLDNKGKIKIDNTCKFSGEGFGEDHEIGECSISTQLIPLCKNVIEIGGGAGKVSHMINTILKNNNVHYQHIVVEPGERGTGNHGNINIYKNHDTFKDDYIVIKKLATELLISDFNILDDKPDCLYVDCEGCLYDFQNTEVGKYVLEHVTFVINEMDGNNENIIKQWRDNGFIELITGYGCGIACETKVYIKKTKIDDIYNKIKNKP